MRRSLHKLIAKILERIALNLKIKVIRRDDGEVYLKRYYVATLFNRYWRVYLHHFVGDDPDGLHCHPWKYGFSIILCGSYTEELRWGYKHVDCFSLVNGDKFHKVILDGTDCWTLFFHSPKLMNWGFLRNKGVFKQFVEVGKNYVEPTQSDWHKDACTGREYEASNKVRT